MNTLIRFTLIILTGFLASCALTPEGKIKQAYKRAAKTQFSQLPGLYAQLEQEGIITPETCKDWIESWGARNKERQAKLVADQKEQQRLAEQRRRWWASLSPAQRLDLEMRERELQQRQSAIVFQADQQRQANMRAAWQNASNSLQHQEEVNAYNARTNALSQPVNVNVRGNIYHNIYGY